MKPALKAWIVFWIIFGIAIALFCSSARSQEPEKQYVRVPTPVDHAQLAAADIATLPDPQFMFYVTVPNPTKEKIGAYQYALNMTISHSSAMVESAVVGNGNLIRVDLRQMCPRADDFARVVSVLTSYVDPYFQVEHEIEIDVTPYTHTDGKKYSRKRIRQGAFGPHIKAEDSLALSLTKLSTPIVDGRRLLGKALTTLDDGLYYKLRGYEGLKQEGFLALFGASESASEALRSNEFTGKWRSNVTAKPRRGVVFPGRGVRPSSGPSLIFLTQDTKNGASDPTKHPIYSLFDFKFDATEIIAILPNGLMAGALFNSKGEIQTSVPPDIAKDHTIPAPHTAELQPFISCGRCHGPDEMLKPFANDVQRMLGGFSGNQRFNVFGDLSKGNQREVIDNLISKYSGNLDRPFDDVRNYHASATFKITKGQSPKEVWKLISSEYDAYFYQPITPFTALSEMGYIVSDKLSDKEVVDLFNKLLPPLPLNDLNVRPEDPAIAALRLTTKEHPLEVTRQDFERVFRDIILRSLANGEGK